jgi:uncharacterized protein (TIGR00251 family)
VNVRVDACANGVRIAVKAVPGSSRDRIAGEHGNALKVCVAAPPEKGKANDRICELLAQALGVPTRDVHVASGTTSPVKTLEVRGVDRDEAVARLAKALAT